MKDNKVPGEANLDVLPISVDKELRTSFLDYAMSVIVSRALPDVRDGLKPVHRRILYAMHNLGLYRERPYRKSATVVGDVIGKYHPHGDGPIYQTMVGMVQDFAKRYPLLSGQGNWGSVDGDSAAAMRYTEVRMEEIARDLLADIEKNTVNFAANFDESLEEPTVLPTRVPQLLINGSNGIAVGMATSIPPHNIGEVLDGCIAVLNNPDLSDKELISLIPAPDFPGGGVICGLSGITKAYKTGHGVLKLRGVVDIEENGNKECLIIKEIPYQVNKSALIEKIADLVKNKVIEGITNIRDESSRDGIRVVIDIKKGEMSKVIMNQLFKHTQLESSISIILLAILDNRPTIFTLREMIDQFLLHRREVIRRRTAFDLAKARAREHVLEGLIIAINNIDAAVVLIKTSKNYEEASLGLRESFGLSEIQAKAVLDMRLNKITSLETEDIRLEIIELKKQIEYFLAILNDSELLRKEIEKELTLLKQKYGDRRRTVIDTSEDVITDLDLIPNDEVVVTLTKKGYVKRINIENYSVQHRGGRGKKGMADLSEHDDFMQDIFVGKNHDTLLFFTNKGRIYSNKMFEIPEGSRIARGRAVINILPLGPDEKVIKLLGTSDLKGKFLVMVTAKGVIKKTSSESFEKIRSTGIIAIELNEGDDLAFCALSSGQDNIILVTSSGYGIRFDESEVRAMGRQAAGVRGILIKGKAKVVGMEVLDPNDNSQVLFATSRGFGKQVSISAFRVAHRGGMGVRTIPVDKRNGEMIGMVKVFENSNILLIDQAGKIIRLNPDEIRTMRRAAKGVRLIKLDDSQTLTGIVAFEEESDASLSNEENLNQLNSSEGQNINQEVDQENDEVLDLEIDLAENDEDESEE